MLPPGTQVVELRVPGRPTRREEVLVGAEQEVIVVLGEIGGSPGQPAEGQAPATRSWGPIVAFSAAYGSRQQRNPITRFASPGPTPVSVPVHLRAGMLLA